MTYTVKLTQQQVVDIADVLSNVHDRKARGSRKYRLSPEKLDEFETTWMMSIIRQMQENHFEINSAKSNVFKWLEDQILYTELDKIEGAWKVHEVLDICRAAGGGQSVWHGYLRSGGSTSREVFKRLFE